MLDKVKLALRITHTFLDDDISDTIALARSEMVRAGVSAGLADSENVLIEGAIKTFCLMHYSNDSKMVEGYAQSWEYQLDNIRKSNLEV